MTLQEFIDRHGLKAILADQPFPEELCPYDEHCSDQYQFFVNADYPVGLGLNDTNEEIRVVYAEMGLADTGWISRADAFAS
jgi:hypothetical protein